MRAHAALVALSAVTLAGCPPPATDVFASLSGIPGGSLLSAWVSPDGTRAYLVGGLVGVDRASAPDPNAIGRLVRYQDGRFETVCRSSSVLWWVYSVDGDVFASGEDGTVLRYREGVGCTRIELGITYANGPPTLWGITGSSARSLVFVGGSAAPGGTKGVVLDYDGTRFQPALVPDAARMENLFKTTTLASGATLVIGTNGTVLRRDRGSVDWVTEPLPSLGGDRSLFTVSCGPSRCTAVGGVGVGRVLHRDPAGVWTLDPISDEVSGLNGVWLASDDRAFVVGNNGTTLARAASRFYRPPTLVTRDPLHAVHGASTGTLVLAVGGEMLDPRPTQRATILFRGTERREFTFDGVALRAVGAPRPEL